MNTIIKASLKCLLAATLAIGMFAVASPALAEEPPEGSGFPGAGNPAGNPSVASIPAAGEDQPPASSSEEEAFTDTAKGDTEGAADGDGDGAGAADNVPEAPDAVSPPDSSDDAGQALDGTAEQTGEDTLEPLADPPLAQGLYIIRLAKSNTRVLDVVGGSNASRANAQIFDSNMTEAQLFELRYSAGFYTIMNVKSKRYLDVAGGRAAAGTNVWQYDRNDTKAQKWVIERTGNAYTITSALSNKLALDVSGAQDANGANVQVWTKNGTSAQSFAFISLGATSVSSQNTIKNGIYTIVSNLSTRLAIDVPGANTANGVQLQLYTTNGTFAQMFEIKYQLDDGFYTIRPLSSGGALDVSGGNVVASTSVQQWTNNGTDAQRWALQKNSDGSFTFVSKKSGLVLDATGGRATTGTRLQLWYSNSTAAQRFKILAVTKEPLTSGALYTISPLSNTAKRIGIPSGSKAEHAEAVLSEGGETAAQRFEATRVEASVYTFRSQESNLYLAGSGSVVDQQKAIDASARWKVEYTFKGYRLTNMATSKTMDARADDSRVGLSANNGSSSQTFVLKQTIAINPGTYTITAEGGRAIDVNGGKFDQGTNVQIFTANGTGAQAWRIEPVRDDLVTLRNVKSQLVLDVANGKTTEGTNVWQWVANGTAAQLWRLIPLSDGSFNIRSESGMYLTVADGKNYDGCNVCVSTSNSSAATRFRFKSSSYNGVSGNTELDTYLATIMRRIGSDGDTLRKCFDYVVGYRYISGSIYPTGEWSIPFASEMYRNGGGNCYRFAALFCWLARANGFDARVISGQVPSLGGGWTAHAWTEVIINGKVYICDPDGQHEVPRANWYLRTYDSPPTNYRKL
jgi:hypothetical protein